MKTKIVIASTLKPVDDVRAYWKFAQSMVGTNKGKYDVNIIGNKGKKVAASAECITFHPHKLLRGQLLKRVFLPWSTLLKIKNINPDILIINTHELLFVALISKRFINCRLIYDVQENYSLNAIMKANFFGKIVSVWIAIKERVVSKYIDHFTLAEACYADQLPFLGDRYSIIQNKATARKIPKRSGSIRLLFSGTISSYAGASYAMKIAAELLKTDRKAEALFIGQVHDRALLLKLEELATLHDRVKLKTSFRPISHDEILQAIDWATLGIISYLPNEINQHKIPTKLYEYSRYQLPYLIQKSTFWEKKGVELGGAIPIEISTPDIKCILKKCKNTSDLFLSPYPEEQTWEYESKKLLNLIDTFS